MGVDFTALKSRPDRIRKYQQSLKEGLRQVPNIPPVVEEVFKDAEKLLLAGKIPPDGDWNKFTGIVILKTKRPYRADQIGQVFQGQQPQKVNGKDYYRITNIAGQALPQGPMGANGLYLGMPSDRTLILAYVPQSELQAAMSAAGGKPRVPASTLDVIRRVDKSMTWGAVPLDGFLGQKLKELQPQHLMMVPELQQAVTPLHNARAVLFTGDLLANDNQRLTLGIICADTSGAQQLTSALKNFWYSQKIQDGLNQFTQAAQNQMGIPSFKAVIDEFRNSLAFTTDGQTALVSFEVSEKAAERFQKDAERLQQGRPGGLNPFGF
jgi:hypothetical protein